MFKQDYDNAVYVVGIQESGGCCLTSGRCYTKYQLAEAELAKDRADGIKYTRIFTLIPHHQVRPTPKYL
jgi:hypothetical protein